MLKKITLMALILHGSISLAQCPNLNGVYKKCKLVSSNLEEDIRIPPEELALVEYHIQTHLEVKGFSLVKKWISDTVESEPLPYETFRVGQNLTIIVTGGVDGKSVHQYSSSCSAKTLFKVHNITDYFSSGKEVSTYKWSYSLKNGKLVITEDSYFDDELENIHEVFQCEK